MDLAGHTTSLWELPVGRVTGLPAFTGQWDVPMAGAFTHIFNFKIHLYPELLFCFTGPLEIQNFRWL